jgi:hypothetical protein
VTALAGRNEQSPVSQPQVRQAQAENFAPAKPAQQHSLDHCPVMSCPQDAQQPRGVRRA